VAIGELALASLAGEYLRRSATPPCTEEATFISSISRRRHRRTVVVDGSRFRRGVGRAWPSQRSGYVV
jgi:hypothetical protein